MYFLFIVVENIYSNIFDDSKKVKKKTVSSFNLSPTSFFISELRISLCMLFLNAWNIHRIKVQKSQAMDIYFKKRVKKPWGGNLNLNKSNILLLKAFSYRDCCKVLVCCVSKVCKKALPLTNWIRVFILIIIIRLFKQF